MLYVASAPADEPSQIGFIVAKTVGNAVTRNLVKRRLREIARSTVRDVPLGLTVVVRALPASAKASFAELQMDYGKAYATAVSRLSGHHRPSTPATRVVVSEQPTGQGGDAL